MTTQSRKLCLHLPFQGTPDSHLHAFSPQNDDARDSGFAAGCILLPVAREGVRASGREKASEVIS